MTERTPQLVGAYAFAVFLFAVMDLVAKALSAGYSTSQVVFFRSLFGCLFLVAVTALSGKKAALHFQVNVGLIIRGLTVVASLYLFFVSLRYLPLPTAAALSLAAPLFMVVIGKVTMHERIGKARLGSIATGVAGVLLIVGIPGVSVFDPVALITLASAFLYALSAAQSRRLSASVSPLGIALSTNVVMVAVSGLAAMGSWQPMPARDLFLFFVMGLCGSSANWIFSSVYQRARISEFAVFEYSILVWAAIFGYIFFRDIPRGGALIGMILIALGGILSATLSMRESRSSKSPLNL